MYLCCPLYPEGFEDYETNGIRSPCPVLYTLLEVRFVSSSFQFPFSKHLATLDSSRNTTDYPLHRIIPRERAIKRWQISERANLSSSPKRGRWIGGVSHRGRGSSEEEEFALNFARGAQEPGTRNSWHRLDWSSLPLSTC